MRTAALQLRGVSKSFGGVHAVNDCSFNVAPQSVTGLVGPNGAGKSTVVELISGFHRLDAGEILLGSTRISGKPPYWIARKGVSRSFQKAREWGSMTVLENLLVAGSPLPVSGVWRSLVQTPSYRRDVASLVDTATQVIETVGLAHLIESKAEALSGGQRRLLDFGRILMAKPTLVLLDEPLAGVNPTLHPMIANSIAHLQSSGITVLLIEHNLDFVDAICDDVVVMALGTPIAQGPLAELRRQQHVVDAYLGESADV